jgi:hypothetical protein
MIRIKFRIKSGRLQTSDTNKEKGNNTTKCVNVMTNNMLNVTVEYLHI